jgi:hypothetical protein
VTRTAGAVFYPPVEPLARLLAPLDRRLGAACTFGAAFVAIAASAPGHRSTAAVPG